MAVERGRPERHAFGLARHAKLSYSQPTSIPNILSRFSLAFVAMAAICLLTRRMGPLFTIVNSPSRGRDARATNALLSSSSGLALPPEPPDDDGNDNTLLVVFLYTKVIPMPDTIVGRHETPPRKL